MKLFFEKINPLEEADFTSNKQEIQDHYESHVLNVKYPNEPFNPSDPKFPWMSLNDYKAEAKELSELQVGKSNSGEPLIGFMIPDKRNPSILRQCKIRRDSKFMTGYSDIVIYRDWTFNDNNIMTFYLAPKTKIPVLLKKSYAGELPENEVEDKVNQLMQK